MVVVVVAAVAGGVHLAELGSAGAGALTTVIVLLLGQPHGLAKHLHHDAMLEELVLHAHLARKRPDTTMEWQM